MPEIDLLTQIRIMDFSGNCLDNSQIKKILEKNNIYYQEDHRLILVDTEDLSDIQEKIYPDYQIVDDMYNPIF